MNFKAITHNSPRGVFREIITKVGIATAVIDPNVDDHVPTTYWTNCLWDTGASHSAITTEVVEVLGLQSIGETTSLYAQGEAIVNVYKVSLNLPNLLFLPRLQVTECATNNAFGVIIGMDVICRGDFAITNVGGVSTFSFCVPSMETIDYLERITMLEDLE